MFSFIAKKITNIKFKLIHRNIIHHYFIPNFDWNKAGMLKSFTCKTKKFGKLGIHY